jgi:hypothetical protein
MTEAKPRSRSSVLISYATITISVVALVVSSLTSYNNSLKPFELSVRVSPQMQIQFKGNLGLYMDVDFFNKSPKNGLITELALVLYKITAAEDKYLLEMNSFRVLDTNGIYRPSQEELPIFLVPWQRSSRTISFIYDIPNEQFPVSMGTYECELLVWIDDEYVPKYREKLRFELTADILNVYLARREKQSTTLQPISIVGYTQFKSRKLTTQEYDLFK